MNFYHPGSSGDLTINKIPSANELFTFPSQDGTEEKPLKPLRVKWTSIEDHILLRLGLSYEKDVYMDILGRTKSSCTKRFNDQLSNDIKTPLSSFEIERLPKLYKLLENQWTFMGKVILLPEPKFQRFMRLSYMHNATYALSIVRTEQYPIRSGLTIKSYWRKNGAKLMSDYEELLNQPIMAIPLTGMMIYDNPIAAIPCEFKALCNVTEKEYANDLEMFLENEILQINN